MKTKVERLMAKKPKKYLVETSAVRPALGDSTPEHCQHFHEQVQGGNLYTSIYIRMEFIRRWVCDTIRMAILIAQCSDVADALCHIEQDFSPRSVKGALAVIQRCLREAGTMDNTSAAAEEIGRLAVSWLKRFDKVFPSRITNICKCQIGGKTDLDRIDFNHLLEELHAFREEFLTPITDCEVNSFLALSAPQGRAAPLLADSGVLKTTSGEKLKALKDSNKWITCTECASIGDAITALEQPASWCLVHIDNAFNDLCRVRERNHLQIQSVLAIQKHTRPETH
jgi:hypothetical protein